MPTASGRFVELHGARAMSAGPYRALARRVWHGKAPVPAALCQRAAQLAEKTPELAGRVHELGRFADEAGWLALNACLPAKAAAALRRPFEWYGCRGAGFHTDAHYDAVLFGAWCLAGPDRDVVFAGSGLRLKCAVGELVVFDPFQPHAVLDQGQAHYDHDRYAGSRASVFLGFELELTAAVHDQFGIGPAQPGAIAISSATVVNAETGTIRF
jgi:hypothetical protein